VRVRGAEFLVVTAHKTLAVLSGAAVAAAHPQAAIWPLGWIGLAPLLYAVRGKSPRRAAALGWMSGMAMYAALLYWIAPTISNFTRITSWQALAVLILACSILASFIGVFCALLEWLAQAGISRVVAAPVLWVAVEWSRVYFPVPFPWALLGYTQYSALPLVQIADIGGVYLVSAVLVFMNAAFAELARAGWRGRPLLLAAVVGLPLATAGYGFARLASLDGRDGGRAVRVGVAQANIAQAEKWDRRFEDDTLETYLRLSREAADAGAELIVWPEAAVPFFVPQDPRSRWLSALSAETGAQLFVGTPGYERRAEGEDGVYYNRAWHVTPEGGLVRSYDKIQLVPFGEYVPFGFLLSWVDRAVEVVGDFGAGEEYVVFDGPARFSGLICYEGIFPALTRAFVAGGAELLVNVSNDAWYGRSSAPYQHLAMASVRAVENRVPLVRATNTGISAVIDRTGRIRATTALFEETWFVETVDAGYAGSIYTALGDWFVYSILAVLGLLVAVRFRNGSFLTG